MQSISIGIVLGAGLVAILLMGSENARFLAPPAGHRRLLATWTVVAAVAFGSFGFAKGPWAMFGLVLMCTAILVGLFATILRREAYNRASGLPLDYEHIPEQLSFRRRLSFAVLGVGGIAGSVALSATQGWESWHTVAMLAPVSLGLGIAAWRGRLDAWTRRHLRAENPSATLRDGAS